MVSSQPDEGAYYLERASHFDLHRVRRMRVSLGIGNGISSHFCYLKH